MNTLTDYMTMLVDMVVLTAFLSAIFIWVLL